MVNRKVLIEPILMIMKRQLHTILKFKGATPYVFLCLFFISQLGLIHHQFSHNNAKTQSTCLICIFTPNHIHEGSISLVVESIQTVFKFLQSMDDVAILYPNIHYLGRAPPVC